MLAFLIVLVVSSCRATSEDGQATTVAPQPSDSGWVPTEAACAYPGESGTCDLPGYSDRPYDVHVPASYDSQTPLPVVVAFHGGGGSSQHGAEMSCPDGDPVNSECLHSVGSREGFATVYPNGTGFLPLRRLRTWNAGGSPPEWNCASGRACSEGVDDMAFVDALIADIASWLNVDRTRVYAVGLSNGAAISHRIACERSEDFAAVVGVAGSNQFSTGADCVPTRGIGVLQIHGTADPCWTFETSDSRCLGSDGKKLGAVESVTGWAERLDCGSDPAESDLPDRVDDGTHSTVTEWSGCRDGVSVQLLTVHGGGHTWPNGSPAFDTGRVGLVARDFGSEVVWEFLSTHTNSQG